MSPINHFQNAQHSLRAAMEQIPQRLSRVQAFGFSACFPLVKHGGAWEVCFLARGAWRDFCKWSICRHVDIPTQANACWHAHEREKWSCKQQDEQNKTTAQATMRKGNFICNGTNLSYQHQDYWSRQLRGNIFFLLSVMFVYSTKSAGAPMTQKRAQITNPTGSSETSPDSRFDRAGHTSK